MIQFAITTSKRNSISLKQKLLTLFWINGFQVGLAFQLKSLPELFYFTVQKSYRGRKKKFSESLPIDAKFARASNRFKYFWYFWLPTKKADTKSLHWFFFLLSVQFVFQFYNWNYNIIVGIYLVACLLGPLLAERVGSKNFKNASWFGLQWWKSLVISILFVRTATLSNF